MHRLLYALAVGLVGAGIVHIAVLLLLPDFSERDAWSRLADRVALYTMTRIDRTPAAEVIHRSADPLFYVAACRFSLEDGFAHITTPGKVPFWSVSVYDRSGQNIYSFNDRTATEGELDFVVLTPPQMIEVRKELPETLVSSIFVEADIDEGIVLVRAFVPDDSWAPRVAGYMNAMICRQE
jgi:uncharacterized membrane protein